MSKQFKMTNYESPEIQAFEISVSEPLAQSFFDSPSENFEDGGSIDDLFN